MSEIIEVDSNDNKSINNMFNIIFTKGNVSEKLVNEFNKSILLGGKFVFYTFIDFNNCVYYAEARNSISNLVYELYNSNITNLIIIDNNKSYNLYGIIIRILYFNYNTFKLTNEKLQYYLNNITIYDNSIIRTYDDDAEYEEINYKIIDVFIDNFDLIFNNKILLFSFIYYIQSCSLFLPYIIHSMQLLLEKGLKLDVFEWCNCVDSILSMEELCDHSINLVKLNREYIELFDLKNIITNKPVKLHSDEELFSLLDL